MGTRVRSTATQTRDPERHRLHGQCLLLGVAPLRVMAGGRPDGV